MTDDDLEAVYHLEKIYDLELTGSELDRKRQDLSQEVFRIEKNQYLSQFKLFRSG
ncbi:MAG: hypothetical protein U1E78_01835 [Gammaproteobacteria bacterium]